jgi:hypothetical protein
MTARLPERGELVTIRWPGGPHDIVIKFDCVPSGWPAPAKGWVWLRGQVKEPRMPAPWVQVFHVQPIDGGYELMPHVE